MMMVMMMMMVVMMIIIIIGVESMSMRNDIDINEGECGYEQMREKMVLGVRVDEQLVK